MQLYPETNTENLAIVFNRSIRKEAFPDSLKIVSVIALLKKKTEARSEQLLSNKPDITIWQNVWKDTM